MKERYLLIDDDRRWEDALNHSNLYDGKLSDAFPNVEFHIARTFDAGIEELKKGNWDVIYIDHDLGCGIKKTGFQILDFLKQNKNLIPKELHSCSGHGGHKIAMYKIIDEMKKV